MPVFQIVKTLNLSQSIKCEIKYEHLSRLETNHYPLVDVWDIPSPPLPPSVRNNIPIMKQEVEIYGCFVMCQLCMTTGKLNSNCDEGETTLCRCTSETSNL